MSALSVGLNGRLSSSFKFFFYLLKYKNLISLKKNIFFFYILAKIIFEVLQHLVIVFIFLLTVWTLEATFKIVILLIANRKSNGLGLRNKKISCEKAYALSKIISPNVRWWQRRGRKLFFDIWHSIINTCHPI